MKVGRFRWVAQSSVGLTVSSRDCFTGTSFTVISFVKLVMPAVKVAMVQVTANATPVLCRTFHRRGWYMMFFKVG